MTFESRSSYRVVWMFMVALLWGSGVAAQQSATVKNSHTVTCASCRITLDSLFTVGSSTDSVLPSQLLAFDRDSRGRFVGIGYDHFSLVYYDSRGVIEQTVGRRGSGPGEFSGTGIRNVTIGAADSVIVLDNATRVSVVSPERRVVREFRVTDPRLSHLEVLNDGRFLTTYARSDSGFLLLSDANGKPIRWLGRGKYDITDSLTFPRNAPLRYTQIRLARDQRSIWVMQENNIFRIQQWNLDGNPGAAFEFVDVPWMTAPHMQEMAAGSAARGLYATRGLDAGRDARNTRPPPPPYRYMAYDYGFSLLTGEVDGIIWVRRWTRPQGSTSLTDRRFYLDAVDARTGRLLATRETNPPVESFSGVTDLVYSSSEDANGVITRTIWRLRLVRR
jgi:hypothetical protein